MDQPKNIATLPLSEFLTDPTHLTPTVNPGAPPKSASEHLDAAACCKSVLPFATTLLRRTCSKKRSGLPLSSDDDNSQDALTSALTMRFLCSHRIEVWDEMMEIRVMRIQSMLRDPNSAAGLRVQGNVKAPTQRNGLDDDDMGTEAMLLLAKEQLSEFQKAIPMDVLNTVISLLESSPELFPSERNDPKQIIARSLLADAQYLHFRASNDVSGLDRALANVKGAFEQIHSHGVHTAPPELDLTVFEARMQALMLERTTYTGEFKVEERFARAMRESGRNTSHAKPENLRYVMPCAGIFDQAQAAMTQFVGDGQRERLDEAIALHREALRMRAFPHPYRIESLEALSGALARRFESAGQQANIDKAILLSKEALNIGSSSLSFPPSKRATLIYNTANALTIRCQHGGPPHDLDDALTIYRESLAIRTGAHPARPWSLFGLAHALLIQNERRRDRAVLDEAVDAYREAVSLCPTPSDSESESNSGNSALSKLLSALATALWTRYRSVWQRGDLDEAIQMFRQSAMPVDLLERSDEVHHYAGISNFAAALAHRFEVLGIARDLDEAIVWQKQSVGFFQRVQHPERHGPLNNLANMLACRYKRGGQEGDLRAAVILQRQVLELRPPGHPDRAGALNNLGNLLLEEVSGGRGGPDVLEEAIALHRGASGLCPPPDSNRYTSLVNLANSLSERFKREGNEHDFREVVGLHREAIKLLPASHPKRYASLHNLGKIFWSAYSRLGQKTEYLDEAISSLPRCNASSCLLPSASSSPNLGRMQRMNTSTPRHLPPTTRSSKPNASWPPSASTSPHARKPWRLTSTASRAAPPYARSHAETAKRPSSTLRPAARSYGRRCCTSARHWINCARCRRSSRGGSALWPRSWRLDRIAAHPPISWTTRAI